MVVKRFQREAELLSRLNHPRIVNLHAYGTSTRGQPYFVMDFLVGDNLVTVLKREDHLDPERFQDIFVQVCAAVEHAHKHGAIHRDIKPGNIMLTRTKRTKDYVKVVDFGIAKLAEEAQKLTRLGEVWGSPIYMSPEQCMGAAIDARSDIYSLGIVMYECLTGRVPFLGRNYADTMGKQISEVPPSFAKIRPDLSIPHSLETIVMTALTKDPDGRYQSLTQMRKDLEAALSAQPSGAITLPPRLAKSQSKVSAMGQQSVARASANKMKAMGAAGRRDADNSLPKQDAKNQSRSNQSRNNLRSQTAPDMERPKKNSTTRSRLEPAVINPHRVRNLILIAGGSLILTASLIAVFTHGELVATYAASLIKQVVGGIDDDQRPAAGSMPTSPTGEGGAEGGAGSGAGAEKDPQKALQDWLSPSGGTSVGTEVGPTGETGQGTSNATGQENGQDKSGSTVDPSQEQSQIKAAEDEKQQETQRHEQERQEQQKQDQERQQQEQEQQQNQR
jgi:serine/threonine protein kinase